MRFNTFFIPMADDGRAQDELNEFLRSKRVLAVEKAFTGQGWSFCVEWLEGGKAVSRNKPKVDYREVLSPEEFALFSRLRDKRKELAQRDGVQVYTIMTNEQLAEMVRGDIRDLEGLRKIDGVGASRIEKYGAPLLEIVNDKN
jgi:superfamily II DNA helicase RecQ